ncbi:uncharacterized protein LAESUDRAFT_340604 [Laetiporus sulphureus 93-53]|uniref:Uncharacterized protein n=1 Tax=Laetiporus sulphureus 93-53 TaxID=1314785 RepID=A0A165GNZ7_9APHY|nr:uncharacterized protein LAESUDRAFT_340604 [Laetiporus sulphureus 93-53]KZT10609.1 hypothetical protein LAESUDRAFT_340604 [Laetiporus sulphureus 93-53]
MGFHHAFARAMGFCCLCQDSLLEDTHDAAVPNIDTRQRPRQDDVYVPPVLLRNAVTRQIPRSPPLSYDSSRSMASIPSYNNPPPPYHPTDSVRYALSSRVSMWCAYTQGVLGVRSAYHALLDVDRGLSEGHRTSFSKTPFPRQIMDWELDRGTENMGGMRWACV